MRKETEMKLTDILQETYDVCVVGSGPAGIITALEYSHLNPAKKVLLVEYGNAKTNAKNSLDNSIEIKNPLYHHQPYECTNKGLGGTSATWGGRCVMWDEIDFMNRPVLGEGCCWDSELFNDINRYVPRAATYFECGDPVFNLNDSKNLNKQRIAEHFVEGIVTDSVLERWSMPTRFGKRYRKDIEQRANITLLEGFEARDFSTPGADNKVTTLSIREVASQTQYNVKASAFIIATGGQEATRILLRNTQLFKNIGAIPPALGKYYQGHLSGKIASIRFKGDPKKTNYGFIRDTDGTYLRRRFQFSTEFLLDQNLLNAAIWLDNPLFYDPKHHNGAMSFMYLAMITPFLGKRLAPAAIAHTITQNKKHAIKKHIWNVIKGFPRSLTIPASIFYKRYIQQRKLPGIFLYNPENYYALHFHAEQIADPLNRLELGADGEKLVIHYALTDTDINSVIKLHETLDMWLRACGCGELEYWYNKEELPEAIRRMSRGGIHQSGTTRISASPEEGVVDSNLKIWGTDNVYVCSSSAFPTSGQANPTFLLGAFALRLSHHLSRQIDIT